MTTQTLLQEDPQTQRARTRVGLVLQDKWRLDSLLGVGGMAAVYAATHRNGKRVAVKVLHAELGHEDEIKKRFLQEGYAANTIQHDGAVSVLDDDVAPDGSAFLVMELLEGETVEQRWERAGRQLTMHEVLAIADQLLDVLAAAHRKNVIHRDIKPENLFITKNGILKVLDFGIAKVFEASARATATRVGMVMGTPAFMAPEQARARWDEVDGRTDLWAAGATMFTLLTGSHVHEAVSGNEQLIFSATMPARPLTAVLPGVPPPVAAIVDSALAFDRNRRWPDALTMQQAVRAALAGMEGPSSDAIRRPATSTLRMAPQGESGPQPIAPTVIDTTGTTSSSGAWVKERETRLAETAKLCATLAELQQRQTAAKRRTADATGTVHAGRAERTQLEQWFKRQVGTRTAAVEDARKAMRAQMMTIATRALADRSAFGADFDPTREQIALLQRAAESAQRDVTLHEAAMHSYDPQALRRGMVLLGVAAALALALIIAPIVWRATRVVDAPAPVVTEPAHSRP